MKVVKVCKNLPRSSEDTSEEKTYCIRLELGDEGYIGLSNNLKEVCRSDWCPLHVQEYKFVCPWFLKVYMYIFNAI